MTKIIALPDIHEHLAAALPRMAAPLKAADLVLLVGDLTNTGHVDAAESVVEALRRCNPRILAVPGNWDGREVQEYLAREGISMNRRYVMIDGVAYLGVGGSLPGGLTMPNILSEAELARDLDEASAGLDSAVPAVLVCHQPPKDTLNDRAWNGLHVGSSAVRAFIERTQPMICFTGHIHEGRGIDHIGATVVVNPGPLWQGHYAWAEVSVQLSVRSGANVSIRQIEGARG